LIQKFIDMHSLSGQQDVGPVHAIPPHCIHDIIPPLEHMYVGSADMVVDEGGGVIVLGGGGSDSVLYLGYQCTEATEAELQNRNRTYGQTWDMALASPMPAQQS
jgi:hypothetical protein